MSMCPICGKRVKMASGNKRKVHGVWAHKHRARYKKYIMPPAAELKKQAKKYWRRAGVKVKREVGKNGVSNNNTT